MSGASDCRYVFKGSGFLPDAKKLIVNAKIAITHGLVSGIRGSNNTVADLLGIGEATVKRVWAEHLKGTLETPFDQRKGHEYILGPETYQFIKAKIRDAHASGKMIYIEDLRRALAVELKVACGESTLWRALHRWNFEFEKIDPYLHIREAEDSIIKRRQYLRTKRRYITDGLDPIYIDESFLHKNHSKGFAWHSDEVGGAFVKPTGKGQLMAIVGAVSMQGWIKEACLLYEPHKKGHEFVGSFDSQKFHRWLEEYLFPALKAPSLIIMDNAPSHCARSTDYFPKGGESRGELFAWLEKQEYPFNPDALRTELLAKCRKLSTCKSLEADVLVEKRGHKLLRLPPAHPDLNPIELCWGVAKNAFAAHCNFSTLTFLDDVKSSLATLTNKSVIDAISHVNTIEEMYWNEDSKSL